MSWTDFDGTIATVNYCFESTVWANAIANGSWVIATVCGVSPTGRQCAAQGLDFVGSDREIWKRSDRTATVDWKEAPWRMGSSSYDAELIAWPENEIAIGYVLCAN